MRQLPIICFLFSAAMVVASGEAYAVPAFADQTGQPCSACHIGGFGPQLTPFGRQFKLEGYTANTGAFAVPISAMAVASYVHTQKDLAAPPAPHLDTNDNFDLDEASIFLAGHIGDHVGGFVQTTYEGLAHHWGWDNLDVRAMTHETIDGSNVLLGVSLNNSPGTQDVFATLPAWGFPFTDSDMAPAPAAGTVINGALAQAVLGVSAYALWDSQIYTEAGLYWTPGRSFLKSLGTDPDEAGEIDGAAPYFRAAYQKDDGTQNWEVGAFAFFPQIFPGRDSSAGSDDYVDLGVDASYQYIVPKGDVYAVNFRYVHESQDLNASRVLAGTNSHNTLQELHLDGSYYWHNQIGFTAGPFATWGSSDAALYGTPSGSPDSNGILLQADYTPWGEGDGPAENRVNVRVGVQFTMYGKFDGDSHDASDNNTVRLFLWSAF
jgi:hypothetical protein